MIDEDILKQRFAEYEIEHIKSNLRNEAISEFEKIKSELEREWDLERVQLESFYETKIMDSETQIQDLITEKNKFEKELN